MKLRIVLSCSFPCPSPNPRACQFGRAFLPSNWSYNSRKCKCKLRKCSRNTKPFALENINFPSLGVFFFSPQACHLALFFSLSPCQIFFSTLTIMNESFAFWFPSVWTLIGAIFTIISFFLSLCLALGKRDSLYAIREAVDSV